MNNNFFNDYSGLNTLEWWMGQVVDEKNWAGNENDKIHKRDDIEGWGKRYKVRIFGRDSKRKDTADDELEMAEVLFPVTAGSGHAGGGQTANIRQGAYVVGFYKDGVDATEPIIMGVFGNNPQTRLEGKDPSEGFIARSGYKGLTGDKEVATKNIYAEGPSSTYFDESICVNPLAYNVNLVDQVKDGTPCEFIPKTRACEGPGGEMRGMQSAIKNALAKINRIKAEANSFIGAASDLNSDINTIINDATNLISQGLKVTIDKMRGYVVNKLNAGISDLIDMLPPNQRPGANETVETATDTLQCVFNKIIKGLAGLVEKLLREIIDQYINAPMCAVEQFLSSLLGSVLGEITGAIQGALSILNSIFGVAIDFVGKVLDVLSIVSGVLNFLSCDEEPACTAGDQWSFWNGASCALDDVSAGLSSITEGLISEPSTAPPCNTSQLPCGPPVINISGSTGSGALANPIISATGAILGLDLVNGGSGYTTPPNVIITQNCDNGNGAVIQAVLDTQISGTAGTGTGTGTAGTGTGTGTGTAGTGTGTGTGTAGTGTIIRFNVIDSGTGYLPAPDGSTGGNGIKFSEPNDTIIKTPGSGYLSPQKPGNVVNVVPGDVVYLPPSTIVQVFDPNGNIVQTLNGLGQLTPIGITTTGSFTTPEPIPGVGSGSSTRTNPLIGLPGIPDSLSNPGGSYPVVLEIGNVFIKNPGVNYSSEDPIVIIPDNGAILIPIYNDVGSLTDVKIERPGIGFTEYPRVFIDSEFGINAEIIPQFKITRVGDLAEDKDIIPTNEQIINVVDCVGKILPKTSFNIVPR